MNTPKCRPEEYDQILADHICERLIAGEALSGICAGDDMPAFATVMRWQERHPGFSRQLRRARTLQAHALADEVLGVLRNGELSAADKQARCRGLMWVAGRLHPGQYGLSPVAPPEGPENSAWLFHVDLSPPTPENDAERAD
ncbi:MAG: hypothetical protein OEW11_04215 [Nitrospirota bacterium]|nr:hypothetical protein [Nitrospirota bacterium]